MKSISSAQSILCKKSVSFSIKNDINSPKPTFAYYEDIDLFHTVDDRLQQALQESCDKWAPGIEM
jgi:hypothetical protein